MPSIHLSHSPMEGRLIRPAHLKVSAEPLAVVHMVQVFSMHLPSCFHTAPRRDFNAIL